MDLECYSENVLFVGEGDFSFSANYILNNTALKEKVYATCLAKDLTSNQMENIQQIKAFGGYVYTDVDATKLENHLYLKNIIFSKIIFNFPHVDKKMNIRDNRLLVQNFFISSRTLLKENGIIIVSLCKGQGGTKFEQVKREWGNTWKICALAASASLVLSEVMPFTSKFLSYKCTGYRGLQKSFNINGALTHIFSPANLVEIENKEIRTDNAEYYIENCKKLFKNLSSQLTDSSFPPMKVMLFLRKETEKRIKSSNLFFSPLLTCENFACSNTIASSKRTKSIEDESCYICLQCMKLIAALYLSNNSHIPITSSLVCNICCVKYFDAFSLPFYKALTYFCSNKETLYILLNLITKNLIKLFLKDMKEAPITECSISKLSYEDSKLSPNNVSIEYISHLYANYSVSKSNGIKLYSDITISEIVNNNNEINHNVTNHLEIGNIFHFTYNSCDVWALLLNVDLIACLKYHVFDFRTLFFEGKYFSYIHTEVPQIIYRSKSICSPLYMHDISFWVGNDFSERNMLLVVRNTVNLLIKKVVLIDLYYDKNKNQHSRCYRFYYESCSHALPKEKAAHIHTNILRNTLESSLKIHLR